MFLTTHIVIHYRTKLDDPLINFKVIHSLSYNKHGIDCIGINPDYMSSIFLHLHNMFHKLKADVVLSAQCIIFSYIKIDSVTVFSVLWYLFNYFIMKLIRSTVTFLHSFSPVVDNSLATIQGLAALPNFIFFTQPYTIPTDT